MKAIVKISLVLAGCLALAGSAFAHDGDRGGHGGFHGRGGYYGRGGWHGYYHGGVLFGVGVYPGYWDYPYPYPYAYQPPYYPDAYRGTVVDNANGSIEGAVQQALAAKGYYHGRIDGDIGPASREAIRDYQRDSGLSVTGNINSGLVKSLGLD